MTSTLSDVDRPLLTADGVYGPQQDSQLLVDTLGGQAARRLFSAPISSRQPLDIKSVPSVFAQSQVVPHSSFSRRGSSPLPADDHLAQHSPAQATFSSDVGGLFVCVRA